MYALIIDNAINKIITQPKSLVIGDVRYPAKIFQLWTKAEKEAIGIYEVVTNTSNFKDEEYYINTNESFTFADGEVTRSWGTATAKNVSDLKTQKKKTVKQQAAGLLAPTDWYVVKATEVSDYSVPSKITTFRAAVRTKSNEMETAIDNASDVAALETLYTYTVQEDGSVTRPLGQFPTLED
jgi:hypothetical protein